MRDDDRTADREPEPQAACLVADLAGFSAATAACHLFFG